MRRTHADMLLRAWLRWKIGWKQPQQQQQQQRTKQIVVEQSIIVIFMFDDFLLLLYGPVGNSISLAGDRGRARESGSREKTAQVGRKKVITEIRWIAGLETASTRKRRKTKKAREKSFRSWKIKLMGFLIIYNVSPFLLCSEYNFHTTKWRKKTKKWR